MISVVVYGRNDSYGYNLNKRAALSFNCIASLLTDPEDEILFVDYNTPEDFPTFPEAIRDTLTQEARRRLKTLRVRPDLHSHYRGKTHLPVLEAIARNIAVRRSNPRNRWILSTNTDMIFVPRIGSSLTDITAELSPGYYHIPRFDLPESVWETFGRLDAQGTIEACRNLGRGIHLDEVVRSKSFFLYDAPGDFQLILRQDIFDLFGFREDMLLGWHIDANMSKRLYLKYRAAGDLADLLRGYHCNHMRQATPKHSETETDDWTEKVEEVALPEMHSQAQTWGWPLAKFDEIHLSSCPSDRYREALQRTIGARMLEPTKMMYRAESADHVRYDAKHVISYLADIFVNCPRKWNVGWFGGDGALLQLFADIWKRLGFDGRILLQIGSANAGLVTDKSTLAEHTLDDIIKKANAFIFDFGRVTGAGTIEDQPVEIRQEAANLLASFWTVLDAEQLAASSNRNMRRIVTVNTMSSYLEKLVAENLSTARTRISTRLRHGFALRKLNTAEEWLPAMRVGTAGMLCDGGIRTREGVAGHVMFGPYNALRPGRYRLRVRMQHAPLSSLSGTDPQLVLEVVNRDAFYTRVALTESDLEVGEEVVPFEISDLLATTVEARLWSNGHAQVAVSSVSIERMD